MFWIHGATDTFVTTAADHANCSVGSYTHGFQTLEEAATKDDVGAVLESGWVDEASVKTLPVVADQPGAVVYGPLGESRDEPDVVLLRVVTALEATVGLNRAMANYAASDAQRFG